MAVRIEKLTRQHAVDDFNCGQEALNRFLVRFAWQNQQANASAAYVGVSDATVVGFYTLTVGEIAFDDAAERLVKGLARHPVPVMLLARLAVATNWQEKGFGAGLLRDAMLRTLRVADIVGIRALVVHAKDERLKEFYQRYGFGQSHTDLLHLYILVKDIHRQFA